MFVISNILKIRTLKVGKLVIDIFILFVYDLVVI